MTDGVLLELRDLGVEFRLRSGPVSALHEVGFDVHSGQTLGLVGESGCGKSVTLRAILGLLPANGAVTAGRARWGERDLLQMTRAERDKLRGSEISMIFQDPMSSLNPTTTVGEQIAEVLRIKRGLARKAAMKEAITLMQRVGIPSAERRIREFPHHFSGGMRQRVMIALAIACRPRLLLADEPTTALDVTIQDQILALLTDLREDYGMAVILVSHDLGVIGQTCDAICVMYAGSVVEYGDTETVLTDPRHPYTQALLASVPSGPRGALATIGGEPPSLGDLPTGCSFRTRCPEARPECADVTMRLDVTPPDHGCACPFAVAKVPA